MWEVQSLELLCPDGVDDQVKHLSIVKKNDSDSDTVLVCIFQLGMEHAD